MEIRLQKILAAVASRRKAEAYIAEGRVTVNGVTAAVGAKADPDKDEILLDGQTVRPQEEMIYIMLHKPEGVVTTANDPQGRQTVFDLLPEEVRKSRLFSVGRLDYDSSGLLLLTNDGEFAQQLTHPSREVKKTYIARVNGTPDNASLSAFRSGLDIEGKKTAPCEITVTKKGPNAQIRITIHEGRNRQVRKMCEKIGHPVLSLKRVAVGGINLGGLPKGGWRYLASREVTRFISHHLHRIVPQQLL
ncbi:MAG: rRNA pseudouridine synthase [Defluviitaleaceae bacterium]|nr:rRNA pseudouridine synthase [Defluviitaleaceae bacterium]